jgi:hypothetical protein
MLSETPSNPMALGEIFLFSWDTLFIYNNIENTSYINEEIGSNLKRVTHSSDMNYLIFKEKGKFVSSLYYESTQPYIFIFCNNETKITLPSQSQVFIFYYYNILQKRYIYYLIEKDCFSENSNYWLRYIIQ